MRILLLLVVLIAGVIGFAWYSAQTLPDWYEDGVSQQDKVVQQLTDQINEQGAGQFLGNKFADVMNGQLILSESEFNALLLSSLQSSSQGRRVLAVSDAVNAQVRDGQLEVGAVLDLNKVAALDARAREAVQEVKKALPLLDQSKVFLSVSGRPVVRNGEIGFSDQFSIKLGSIPISSALLAKLGVPVHKATESSLPLKYMSVKSIDLLDQQLVLGVVPRF